MKNSKAPEKQTGLTLTVPVGATCGLYAGMPAGSKYFQVIDIHNARKPTCVTTRDGCTDYFYRDPEEGVYHYGVSMEGHTAVCQILRYTKEKAGLQLEIKLNPLAGNGYESGYVMYNTEEFNRACLTSHKAAWGKEYAGLFVTPQFTRSQTRPGYHQQTTNEEMWAFIETLQKNSKNMYVFSLGKSPKYGFFMPLVLFTRENVAGMTLEKAAATVRKNGKPTVQYTAQVHSNEPGSSEGALAMMAALTGDYGNTVLDAVDVYIIPRINLDGAVEVLRRSPTTGDDMNRDYLYMNNRELRMVTGAYNLFYPEVAIDGHEKTTDLLTTDVSRCTDMELQVGAGSLNHPAAMTELAMEMALAAIQKGRELGLRSHFYQNLASAAGGSAGSSYYGTRNSLSFLVETPGGTTLGRSCMERRIMGQYVLASTVISFTAEHSRQVMDTVHTSREKMAKAGAVYDESDRIVLEHGKEPTGSLPTPMLHVLTGQVADPAFEIPYNEQPVALHTRIRPTAYVIPRGLAGEAEILRVAANHDIPWYSLPAGSTVNLRQYTCLDDNIDLSPECPVEFPEGAYVFPNTVPSTVLCVIMEPDFNRFSGRKMTLLSMGLIEPDESGKLPIYRYCHDLKNGRVPITE